MRKEMDEDIMIRRETSNKKRREEEEFMSSLRKQTTPVKGARKQLYDSTLGKSFRNPLR
jgi:hypothetical protein